MQIRGEGRLSFRQVMMYSSELHQEEELGELLSDFRFLAINHH